MAAPISLHHWLTCDVEQFRRTAENSLLSPEHGWKVGAQATGIQPVTDTRECLRAPALSVEDSKSRSPFGPRARLV